MLDPSVGVARLVFFADRRGFKAFVVAEVTVVPTRVASYQLLLKILVIGVCPILIFPLAGSNHVGTWPISSNLGETRGLVRLLGTIVVSVTFGTSLLLEEK